MLNRIKKEIKSFPIHYVLLGVILLTAFFVRSYRQGELLGFYFDQGRDAMVIWKLWNEGKLFLIGPVTGLAGIFLGPFYYYLIAPFYFIGNGNPVYPAVFLSFLTTLAISIIYYLGWKFHNRNTGLIAAVIAALSYYLVLAGRWLSNPTPIFLASMLLLLSMWQIVQGKSKRWWIATAFIVGISFHFEAASAIFYIPMVFIFMIWRRKSIPDIKTLVICGIAFFSTLLPQIIFNFRHDNILIANFANKIFGEKSFSVSFWNVLPERLDFFWDVFYSKILPGWPSYALIITVVVTSVIIVEKKPKVLSDSIKLLLIFIGIPMLGYIFFQGNYGNIYDYYLSGYYFPMVLLFSVGLGLLWERPGGKVMVAIFFTLFALRNVTWTRNYIIAEADEPEHISLGNELQAVNWVFEDAKDVDKFNVDAYVPPVISHSYDYLFLWKGTEKCGSSLCGLELEQQVETLYTLYEVDPPHPERLEAWLMRQKGIGTVEESIKFGGITVQRRKRL